MCLISTSTFVLGRLRCQSKPVNPQICRWLVYWYIQGVNNGNYSVLHTSTTEYVPLTVTACCSSAGTRELTVIHRVVLAGFDAIRVPIDVHIFFPNIVQKIKTQAFFFLCT